jgi:hypothetical protein
MTTMKICKDAGDYLLWFLCFCRNRKSYDVPAIKEDIERWLGLLQLIEKELTAWKTEL